MSWEDIIKEKDTNVVKKDKEYMKMQKGVYKIRLLDLQPVTVWTHYVKSANGGKGLSFTCLGKSVCPCCIENDLLVAGGGDKKYTSREVSTINVLDRADGEVKILSKGKTLFKALWNAHMSLKSISDNPDLKITDHDIQVTVAGSGTDTEYSAIPMKPEVLDTSALEKYDIEKSVAKLKVDDFKRLLAGETIADVFKDDKVDNSAVDFTKG
jgi:hypothetical protein